MGVLKIRKIRDFENMYFSRFRSFEISAKKSREFLPGKMSRFFRKFELEQQFYCEATSLKDWFFKVVPDLDERPLKLQNSFRNSWPVKNEYGQWAHWFVISQNSNFSIWEILNGFIVFAAEFTSDGSFLQFFC